MIITYKNSIGTLGFNTKGDGEIRITAAEGLFLPTPSHYSVNYFGHDGQTTIATYIKNRVITISGDIKISSLKKFMAVLSFAGELTVKKRKISVCTPTLSIGNRYGNFVKYVIQMTCDNPYFTDTENKVPVYYRKDIITSEFTLPTVFTSGISSAVYNNESYYEAHPEIIFNCIYGGNYGGGITLENTSVGCKITLLCTMLTGEIISIDTEKRTAISSKRGNMLKYLSDDSYPGDFILRRGQNMLKAYTNNTSEEIYCDIFTGIRYAECDMFE